MLGDNIIKFRKNKSMSQDELAEKLNVSRQSISSWEDGQVQPSINYIITLAKVFEISTDELLNNNESINEPDIVHAPNIFKRKTEKKNNRKWLFIIGIIVILIALAGIVAYIFLRPFSSNTSAIAKAESSVVKIYCYDYNGKESATGSGFIAYDDKTVVTNYHVMSEAYTCKVSTDQDKTYKVSEILCYSKEKDIAIFTLKESTNLNPLKFGDSDNIEKGETVTAIGSPFGIKNSISQGILSGRLMEESMDVLQFTASISSGSSGGALFNNKGKVIGITFASYEEGQNLNLAIPINEVKTLYLNKDGTSSANIVYMLEHPYIEYIKKYNPVEVTFDQLKTNPELYNKKIIMIQTYISSKHSYNMGDFLFISNIENISGDYEYDNSLRESSGITTPYKKVPIILTHTSKPGIHYDNINIGDQVIIIGKFDYSKIGDIDEYDIVSKVEYGAISLEYLYKK